MRSLSKNNVYWNLPEHLLNKLTIAQLEDLGNRDKETKNEFYFLKVHFMKTHHVSYFYSRILTKRSRRAVALKNKGNYSQK